eukprot:TRINITY_DN26006_c2_g1_i2.p1 TRINITY_DN26006_c2_g1~~TRINITY_DN26006_c2_g1_i2.p1  ORF type:complete len:1346 (+),score=381.72 TRINITY_DN26006_c2_g1_i2:88-4038(+)
MPPKSLQRLQNAAKTANRTPGSPSGRSGRGQLHPGARTDGRTSPGAPSPTQRRPSQMLRMLANDYQRQQMQAREPKQEAHRHSGGSADGTGDADAFARASAGGPGGEPLLIRGSSQGSFKVAQGSPSLNVHQPGSRRVSIQILDASSLGPAPGMRNATTTARVKTGGSFRGRQSLRVTDAPHFMSEDDHDSGSEDGLLGANDISLFSGTGIAKTARRPSVQDKRRQSKVVVPVHLLGHKLLDEIDLTGDTEEVRRHVEAALDEQDTMADPVGDLEGILERARERLGEAPDCLNPYYDPPQETKYRTFYDMLHRNHAVYQALQKGVRLTGRIAKSIELKNEKLETEAARARQLSIDNHRMSTELEALRAQLASQQKTITELEEKMQALVRAWGQQRQEDAQKHEADMAEVTERFKSRLQAQEHEHETELRVKVREAMRDAAAGEARPLVEKVLILEAELEALKEQSHRDRLDMDMMRDLVARTRQEKDNAQDQLVAAETRMREMEEARAAELREALAEQRKEFEGQLADLDRVTAELEAMRQAKQQVQQACSEAQLEVARLSDEVAEMQEAADSARQLAEQKHAELEKQARELKNECEALQRKAEEDKAKAELAEAAAEAKVTEARAELQQRIAQEAMQEANIRRQVAREIEKLEKQNDKLREDASVGRERRGKHVAKVFIAVNERYRLYASYLCLLLNTYARRSGREEVAVELQTTKARLNALLTQREAADEKLGQIAALEKKQRDSERRHERQEERQRAAEQRIVELHQALDSQRATHMEQQKELGELRAYKQRFEPGGTMVGVSSRIARELDRLAEQLIVMLSEFAELFRKRMKLRNFDPVALLRLGQPADAAQAARIPAPVRAMRTCHAGLQRMAKLLQVDQCLTTFRHGLVGVGITDRINLRKVVRKLETPDVPEKFRDFYKRQKEALEDQAGHVEALRQKAGRVQRAILDEAGPGPGPGDGGIARDEQSAVDRLMEEAKRMLLQRDARDAHTGVLVSRAVVEELGAGRWAGGICRGQRPQRSNRPTPASQSGQQQHGGQRGPRGGPHGGAAASAVAADARSPDASGSPHPWAPGQTGGARGGAEAGLPPMPGLTPVDRLLRSGHVALAGKPAPGPQQQQQQQQQRSKRGRRGEPSQPQPEGQPLCPGGPGGQQPSDGEAAAGASPRPGAAPGSSASSPKWHDWPGAEPDPTEQSPRLLSPLHALAEETARRIRESSDDPLVLRAAVSAIFRLRGRCAPDEPPSPPVRPPPPQSAPPLPTGPARVTAAPTQLAHLQRRRARGRPAGALPSRFAPSAAAAGAPGRGAAVSRIR